MSGVGWEPEVKAEWYSSAVECLPGKALILRTGGLNTKNAAMSQRWTLYPDLNRSPHEAIPKINKQFEKN